MKHTVFLSILFVVMSLGSFSCGSSSGVSNTANNGNKPGSAANANIGTSANSSNSNAQGFAADAIKSGSPAATVKMFFDLAGTGNAGGMTKLYSENTIREKSAAKITSGNAGFAKTAQQVVKSAPAATIFNIKETVDGDTAVVRFIYGNPVERGGLHSICKLVKENGEWKITEVSDDQEYYKS